MAITTVQAQNKLIVFRKEVTREYIRQNLFSPYVGTELTAIIRVINDLKKGGEQINIPLVARLKSQRDLDRNARRQRREYRQFRRSDVDRLGEKRRPHPEVRRAEVEHRPVRPARPLLEDWGKELQRNEIVGHVQHHPDPEHAAGRPRLGRRPARQRRVFRRGYRSTTQHIHHRQRRSHPVRWRTGQPVARQLGNLGRQCHVRHDLRRPPAQTR